MLAAEPRARGFLLFGLYTPGAPVWMFRLSSGRMAGSESLRRAALALVARSKNSVFFSHEEARLTKVNKPRFVFD